MFRSLLTIIRELYLYLTKVMFMLKTLGKITSLCVKLRRHICCVQCTAHNTYAALRHAATSPNLYNDVILPNVLT
jgi:hypothetical protein